jgi:mono/diheme cytochrome c family protein
VKPLLPSAVALLLGATAHAQPAAPAFPPGDGQAATQTACAACHPPAVIAGKRYNADKWAEVVDQMIGKGAKVPDADYDVIVNYLARTYGLGK